MSVTITPANREMSAEERRTLRRLMGYPKHTLCFYLTLACTSGFPISWKLLDAGRTAQRNAEADQAREKVRLLMAKGVRHKWIDPDDPTHLTDHGRRSAKGRAWWNQYASAMNGFANKLDKVKIGDPPTEEAAS